METRLSNIFKTTNVMNLKILKQPVYFLKTVEYFEKSCKTTLFIIPTEVRMSAFMSIGLPITK